MAIGFGFSSISPMQSSRSFGAAVLLGGGTKVLVTGGVAVNSPHSAELFDQATGAWTPSEMTTRRARHTATLLPKFNKVLVVGGDNAVDPSTAELYDPTTNSWQVVFNNLNSPRNAHTATLLPDGRVLVSGGQGAASGPSLSTAEIFDPATDPTNGSWTLVNAMNDARAFHTATLLPTGQVLVTGGMSTGFTDSILFSAELFDPISGFWSLTAAMNAIRAFHTATLLSFDPSALEFVVLVAGGMGFNSDPDNSAELYHPPPPVHLSPSLVASPAVLAGTSPDGSSWVRTGSMNRQRMFHTATALFTGIRSRGVLVTGGGDDQTTAEIYDFRTGSWTFTGGLHSPRVAHTATLAGGKLLLAGGGDNSAELGAACNASAQIMVSPATIDFGQVQAGSPSQDRGLTIQNTGNAELTVAATISGLDAALFRMQSPVILQPDANLPCFTTGPGATGTQIAFHALSPTPKTCAATLTLHDSNAVNVPSGTTWVFPLTAEIVASPGTVVNITWPSFFGDVVVGDSTTRDLVIVLESVISLDAAAIVRFPLPPSHAFFTWDAGDYILDQSNTPISVPIDFTPRVLGPASQPLELISNAQGGPFQGLLRGQGKKGEIVP